MRRSIVTSSSSISRNAAAVRSTLLIRISSLGSFGPQDRTSGSPSSHRLPFRLDRAEAKGAAILEKIVSWFGPAFATYGNLIVGAAVLFERSIFIGLIVPGDVVLALGGIYAARDDLDLAWVIVVAVFAAIVGESIGYALGRRYGRALIARLPLVRRLAPRLDAAEDYFRQHGGKTVAIGRFATAVGSFIPFVAGVARMPYRKFLAYDVPAIVVWASGITLVGYLFGSNLDLVDRILRRFGLVALALLAAYVGFRVWKRRRGPKGER